MPLHRALNTKITNPNLCAGATLVVILLCLIIPIAFLFNLLVLEAFDIYKSFDSQGGAWMKTLTATLNTLSQSALFAKLNLDQAFILENFRTSSRRSADTSSIIFRILRKTPFLSSSKLP
jgi:predicted PurR-regulated permease PerM